MNTNDISTAYGLVTDEISSLFESIKKTITISSDVSVYTDLQDLAQVVQVLNDQSSKINHISGKYSQHIKVFKTTTVRETSAKVEAVKSDFLKPEPMKAKVLKTEDLLSQLHSDLKPVCGDNIALKFAKEILLTTHKSQNNRASEIIDKVFNNCTSIMTHDEVFSICNSGHDNVGKNRIKWCRNYLKDADYLKDPKNDGSRGIWELTPKGQEWVKSYEESLRKAEN